jgi:hypothetical protein
MHDLGDPTEDVQLIVDMILWRILSREMILLDLHF